MLFNIKNWQDKHLIKESKLKEMDFKDKAAFDKYQSKHNMRKSTKVSIGGKDTTAGEAGGKEKEASGKSAASVNDKPWERGNYGTDKSFKKTPASEKRKYFSFSPVDGGKYTYGKAMPDLVNGLRNSDASNEESIQNLESTLKAAGVYDLKTVDKKDAIKAIEDVDQSVDAKNDMKKHVENIWDKDHQAESVAPRSARIQESKIYQTIQELKALEKGL